MPIPALICQRKNRDCLGFPRRSRWWVVAPIAVLFSLSAITAVRWYEWELRTASEVRIGGHQIEGPFATHKGGYRLPITSGIGRRIGTGIWEQLDSQNGFFNCYRSPRPKWANWTRLLHRNVEANHILLAGETAAIIHRIRRLSRHSSPQFSRWIRVRNRRRRHQLPAFRRSLSKSRLSFQEHRGKGLGLRRRKAGTNRRGSTELIAALISRHSIRTDGTYGSFCMTQIATLKVVKYAHEVQVNVLDKMA